MPTEAAPAPDTATKNKKRKKDSGHPTDNPKKRKRDEEHHAVAPHPAPPPDPIRKMKKRKREPEQQQDPIPDPQPRAQPDARPTKKHKKSKPHKSKSAPQQPTTTTTTPAPPPSSFDDLLTTHTPFLTQTTTLYLPLSPCASLFPLQALCAEHLSPLLLTYYPPLRGIVLAYSHPRMHAEDPTSTTTPAKPTRKGVEEGVLAKCINEYAVTFLYLTAEFLLFRPRKGTWVEGWVSLQNESLLGLVCYNYFNAVVERDKLPQDWRWEEGGDDDEGELEQAGGKKKKRRKRRTGFGEGSGYFVDGRGEKVKGRVVFRVEDFEASPGGDGGGGGSISIIGTLLPEGSET